MEDKKISYLNMIEQGNIEVYEKILSNYKSNIDKVVKLEGDIPVFLDSNVFLKSYSISFKAREKLMEFFEKYKSRIHITNQVQLEFIKNREDIIERFFDDITNGLPNNFKQGILNKFSSFLEKNKTILVDYENFESELQNIKTKLEGLHESLNKGVQSRKGENNNLILDDPFLNIFSNCNCHSKETNIVENAMTDFKTLASKIDKDKIDSEIKKPRKAFPGIGDIKQKPQNPYGDYIIFHEIMKYANDNSSDIIFLTYDTTKGDWMKFNKNPHIHYIENFYLNTGQMIYILDAKRVLEDNLKLKFTSLVSVTEKSDVNQTLITIKTLHDFLLKKYPEAKSSSTLDLGEMCRELIHNGYGSIEQIEIDADRTNDAYQRYILHKENGSNRFSRVGNIRLRLHMLNPNYLILDEDGKFIHGNRDDYI